MRITNKIMQMNSLNNINTNKINEDTLNNQMASGKKTLRPSDNPVAAIRSLRLRSNLSDITQYHEKNVLDAQSWVKVTQDSINTVNGCIEEMRGLCNKGAVDHMTTENRNIVLDGLKSLKEEVYVSGDADYAGRGVFTGYRTDTKLLFQKNEEVRYDIKEPLFKDDVENITYIKLTAGDGYNRTDNPQIGTINAGNFKDLSDKTPAETDIYETTIYRMRLAYKGIDNPIPLMDDGTPDYDAVTPELAEKAPTISYTDSQGVQWNIPVTIVSKYDTDVDPYLEARKETASYDEFVTTDYGKKVLASKIEEEYEDVDGNKIPEGESYYFSKTGNPKTKISKADYDALTDDADKEFYDTTDLRTRPKSAIEKTPDPKDPGKTIDTPARAVFIPETGEIILNEAAKNIITSLNDDTRTKDNDEGQVNISYTKSDWNKGDLRPEHYFECDQYIPDKYGRNFIPIHHNEGGYDDKAENQIISYDVGFNQDVRVNTLAVDVYDPGITRTLDDLIDIIEQVSDVEATVNSLKTLRETFDKTDTEGLEKLDKALKSAEKAYTFLEDKMQKLFEHANTVFSNYHAKSTLALSDIGTRMQKLDLVDERLASQKTNFEALVAENDQVDIAEVATKLKSAQMAYDASLQATAKINQTTLLNYL